MQPLLRLLLLVVLAAELGWGDERSWLGLALLLRSPAEWLCRPEKKPLLALLRVLVC